MQNDPTQANSQRKFTSVAPNDVHPMVDLDAEANATGGAWIASWRLGRVLRVFAGVDVLTDRAPVDPKLLGRFSIVAIFLKDKPVVGRDQLIAAQLAAFYIRKKAAAPGTVAYILPARRNRWQIVAANHDASYALRQLANITPARDTSVRDDH